jgi:cytoskeletal protein CcmA (bactofilin family)
LSSTLNRYQLETDFISSRSHRAGLASSTAADHVDHRDDAPDIKLCQIRKGTCFSGEIRGVGPLYIDGEVEGNISIPAGRVTVGQDGRVEADISAKEVIVMGKVRGDILASDRVDIRAESSVIGNIAAVHISIEDGAFLKGGIAVRLPQAKPESNAPRS